MIKRAMVLATFSLVVATVSTAASAHVGVGVYLNAPVYAAPAVVYAPPPVVYAPQPVYGYGYGYRDDGWRGRHWHDHGHYRGWDGRHEHGHGRW